MVLILNDIHLIFDIPFYLAGLDLQWVLRGCGGKKLSTPLEPHTEGSRAEVEVGETFDGDGVELSGGKGGYSTRHIT
jgi:hypothetical protein